MRIGAVRQCSVHTSFDVQDLFTLFLLKMGTKTAGRQPYIDVHGHGAEVQPITSQIDLNLELAIDGIIHVNVLLRSWHNGLGMQKALVDMKDIVCLQGNRFCRSIGGQLTRCNLPLGIHSGLEAPAFHGPGLEVQCYDHQVPAVTQRTGDIRQGHHESLIMIDVQPTSLGGPCLWPHIDGNRRA